MGLKPALFWFALMAFLTLTWRLLDLPPESEMRLIVAEWIMTYGLLIVFFGSLLETLLFVGFYFPGSLIIFLSVALSENPKVAFVTVLFVSLGMFFGYTSNYLLGKYGWYRLFLKLGMRKGIENAQIKMQKNDVRYVLYTFWNPGLGSFTATAAGILSIRYVRFASLAVGAIVVWNTFWGVTVYSLGEQALSLVEFSIVLKVIAVWLLVEILLFVWRKYKDPATQ
ncbi:hypothetical protein N8083_01920 [Candidatus Pacebacteria bacterium]|nr:hypothetical protein [Candidatus Paceibacterota bacterium]